MDSDHDSAPEEQQSWKTQARWLQLLFVLLCTAIFFVTTYVIYVVVAAQAAFVIITGQPDARLLAAGGSLRNYAYQLLDYVSCNTTERPFPFADWPDATGLVKQEAQTFDSGANIDL